MCLLAIWASPAEEGEGGVSVSARGERKIGAWRWGGQRDLISAGWGGESAF